MQDIAAFNEKHETTDDELRAAMGWSNPDHDIMGDLAQAWRDAKEQGQQ